MLQYKIIITVQIQIRIDLGKVDQDTKTTYQYRIDLLI
jgi:hypothetical protein